jgi:SulP family sulfate permease
MTAGLGLGVICAALTFTLQTSRHVYPIRGKMCGRTLRSSRWRTPADAFTLNGRTRHIIAVQLQGHLFFGNAMLLAEEIERMLDAQEQGCQGQSQGQPQGQGLGQGQEKAPSLSLWFIVLDFTLVVGIDSSAAETIGRLFKMCRARGVRLCYSAGGEGGFPCTFPLSGTCPNPNPYTLTLPSP